VNLAGSPFGGTFTGTGIVGNVFSPQAAGTGTFVVSYSYTGSNACSGMAHTNIIVANCTGIEEMAGTLTFEVYPNPASDELHVSFPDMEPRTISIYSMNGTLVHSEKVNAMQHTLHLSWLSKGLYIVKVNGAEGQSSKKILLQ
jgi:phage-related protein